MNGPDRWFNLFLWFLGHSDLELRFVSACRLVSRRSILSSRFLSATLTHINNFFLCLQRSKYIKSDRSTIGNLVNIIFLKLTLWPLDFQFLDFNIRLSKKLRSNIWKIVSMKKFKCCRLFKMIVKFKCTRSYFENKKKMHFTRIVSWDWTLWWICSFFMLKWWTCSRTSHALKSIDSSPYNIVFPNSV